MSTIRIDRRLVLFGGLALSTAAVMTSSEIVVADELAKWLNKGVMPGPTVISPEVVGILPEHQSDKLTSFALHLSKTWELDAASQLTKDDVLTFIDAKTSEPPSYLAEYTLAHATIARAIKDLSGDETKAFDLLAFGQLDGQSDSTKRIGRFRRFVFEEFTRFLIYRGGFRLFKPIENYRGYVGGPFTQPNVHLPYRGRQA